MADANATDPLMEAERQKVWDLLQQNRGFYDQPDAQKLWSQFQQRASGQDAPLLVNCLGGGRLHFAVHVLPQGFFVIGVDGAGLAFFGLATATIEWAFGAHFGTAPVDSAAVFGFTDHRQDLPGRTGKGVIGFVIGEVGLDQFAL